MSIEFGSQEANKILKKIKEEEATHCDACGSEIKKVTCYECTGTGTDLGYSFDEDDYEYDDEEASCGTCDGVGDMYQCDCGKYLLTLYELEYRINCKQAVIK